MLNANKTLLKFFSWKPLKLNYWKSYLYSSLECISLPPSVTDLQEGWCRGASCLTKVKISPDSKNFKYLNPDEKIILSKSNQESELFDDIIFASSDIEKVEIPNFIKRIKSYSFYECEFLKTVTFSEKSTVESICKELFPYSSTENIFIPNSVKFIGDGAFSWCQNLHNVEFEEGSQLNSAGKELFQNHHWKRFQFQFKWKRSKKELFHGVKTSKPLNFRKILNWWQLKSMHSMDLQSDHSQFLHMPKNSKKVGIVKLRFWRMLQFQGKIIVSLFMMRRWLLENQIETVKYLTFFF